MKLSFSILASLLLVTGCQNTPTEPVAPLTHGPMLGRQTTDSIIVWARTKNSSKFHVRYGLEKGLYDQSTEPVITKLKDDNTGTITLDGLEPGKKYHYAIFSETNKSAHTGSFKTLRDIRL